MVLSDRTIQRLLDEGRIGIEPYDSSLLQPSSVDVRVDRYFRVFHNARYAFIDVREPQEDLTEEVVIEDDEKPFILHPGEFVLGSTLDGWSSEGSYGSMPMRPSSSWRWIVRSERTTPRFYGSSRSAPDGARRRSAGAP